MGTSRGTAWCLMCRVARLRCVGTAAAGGHDEWGALGSWGLCHPLQRSGSHQPQPLSHRDQQQQHATAVLHLWGKHSYFSAPNTNCRSHKTLARLMALTWQQLNSLDNFSKMYLRKQTTSQNTTELLLLLHKELYRC